MSSLENNQLSERFRNFANLECKGSSPLYQELSSQIAEDEELLLISSHASDGQPVPNLLLGAVHFLLLNGKQHDLINYYPSLVKDAKEGNGAFPIFKDFCQTYSNDIIEILKSKRVQTNEVRRCAYLYPIFCDIFNTVEKPLSLIEIGTSAGLQLVWDHYSYSYGDSEVYGNENAYLHLTSAVREGSHPNLLKDSPPVHSRIGIDLNIMDVSQKEEYLWLRALIWPEHQERLHMFDQAVKQFNETPPTLVEGDGVNLINKYAREVPEHTALCIFHTHVANQIPDAVKENLLYTVKEISKERDVFHIYNNIWDRKLHVDSFIKGVEHSQIVGETDGHGRWFDWKSEKIVSR